jgi:glycosyltransferase involved in cell wall biosynthesis
MEGFGLVIVEAMGCKCPVVVGDVPAVTDIAIDMKTGLLCKSESEEQLKLSILKLLKNPMLSKELAENAYQHIHQNFSWDEIGKCYIELIRIHS